VKDEVGMDQVGRGKDGSIVDNDDDNYDRMMMIIMIE